ncbi:MAG: hypothetical protein HUJ26_18105 [Planctomycetaceae bacterium]|nr:hypothetical protein [Planctomycetaceae bacterium]
MTHKNFAHPNFLEETLQCPELFQAYSPSDRFQAGLKQLSQLPIHRSLYEVASCLWEMWNSDPPNAGTFWAISINSQLELAGIAVISDQTRKNWSNYHTIDDSITWEQTLEFQISHENIAFGPHKKPSFYGLYQYLKKVSRYFLETDPFNKPARVFQSA